MYFQSNLSMSIDMRQITIYSQTLTTLQLQLTDVFENHFLINNNSTLVSLIGKPRWNCSHLT